MAHIAVSLVCSVFFFAFSHRSFSFSHLISFYILLSKDKDKDYKAEEADKAGEEEE